MPSTRLAWSGWPVLVGDQGSAEDIVQDAFLGLFRRWDRLPDTSYPLAYVRVSVLNGCRTALRRRSRWGRTASFSEAPAESALVAARLDKTCSNAVIGQDLISALRSGQCTQVLRASYVSGDNKIMGTIGVVNLDAANEAHYAEKLAGVNDYVTPLRTSQGIASKLGRGTGVVAAEFKGHYLILTWAEFTSTHAPTTTAQKQQLEQFNHDLMAGRPPWSAPSSPASTRPSPRP